MSTPIEKVRINHEKFKGRSVDFDSLGEMDSVSRDDGCGGFYAFEQAWRGKSHRLPGGDRLTIKDAHAMWEAPLFIPKVINNIIQEAVEPLLIGERLLRKIPFVAGTQIELPVFGAIDGDFDVGEEESFPEVRMHYGPGHQISRIGKQGVAVKFTEEALRYSQFDIVSMAVSQAAKALARNKEEKIFTMIYNVARTTHDNLTPASSTYGTTTGRDITGAQNGSFTMDDLFEMLTQVMHNGWVPDTVLVHPLTWLMFVQDAQLRAFAQNNQTAFFGGQWTGDPARRDFDSSFGGQGATGGMHRTHSQAPIGADGDGNALPKAATDFSQNMNAAPVIPNYLGMPLQVLVSPFVPYDAVNNTTTVMVGDSNQFGFLVEEHGPQTTEWMDPETDITKIKIKQRFVVREKDRGLGLAVAKNVVVASNQIILPAQATIDVAGSITNATRGVAVP